MTVPTLHVHLDHDHCLEVLVVRGQACPLREMADRLIGARSVTHGKLTPASTGTTYQSRALLWSGGMRFASPPLVSQGKDLWVETPPPHNARFRNPALT